MGIKLNYKILGDGAPVIILHGLFGMLDNWKTFGRKLGEHYKVYLVDQRDHGKSPHTDTFNYNVLSKDLKDFLEQHNVEKCKLIGHSMGGRTILQFSKDFPECIDKMIVVDMGLRSYKGGHELIFDALLSLKLELFQSRKELDEELSKDISDWGVRQFLLKNIYRQTNGHFAFKMNLQLLHLMYHDIMSWQINVKDQIQTKTLFVKASKSNYISENDEILIRKHFQNATIRSIQAGHWIHAEKPLELLEYSLNFFN